MEDNKALLSAVTSSGAEIRSLLGFVVFHFFWRLAGHGRPWPAMAGHDWPEPLLAGQGWPWPTKADHGRPWPTSGSAQVMYPQKCQQTNFAQILQLVFEKCPADTQKCQQMNFAPIFFFVQEGPLDLRSVIKLISNRCSYFFQVAHPGPPVGRTRKVEKPFPEKKKWNNQNRPRMGSASDAKT